jgi:oxygen-dependent protoporphyrinogen oxidase
MQRKEKRHQPRFSQTIPDLPCSAIYSLQSGIEHIIQTLLSKIPAEVHYRSEVTAIHDIGQEMEVVASDQTYRADAVFCALPVAQVGFLLKPLFPDIAEKLSQIKSCSVCVMNLGYTQPVLPVQGFGYLTATQSKEDILGVVFDSSVFPQHNERLRETRLTIKLEDRGLSKESMIENALQGIKRHLGISHQPDAISYKRAIHAIPQYGVGHLDAMQKIEQQLIDLFPRCRLVGNYLSGVSVDQCIARSKDVAQQWVAQQHL